MSDNERMYLSDDEILNIIKTENQSEIESLYAAARKVREDHLGNTVFFRALIEFTNYCKNDCYYCGLRRSNKKLRRYRLSLDDILESCRRADVFGCRTFVLQGGEDPWFSADRMAEIISAIKKEFPGQTISLSIGERSRQDYELFFKAGVKRFLLRHEPATEAHYTKLHPPSMSFAQRRQCLKELKETGYETGAGFMVGTPYQTEECLLADLRFLEELQPQMAGIGPFIPQKDTPFSIQPAGSLELSLKMIALTRLLLPGAYIPATTAMETISPNGREAALNAGANVVMPNFTPLAEQKLYTLYDNIFRTYNETSGTGIAASLIEQQIIDAGYVTDIFNGSCSETEVSEQL
jgi:biotin synthase